MTTRKEALAAGQKTYFTDKPCRNGHVAHRYTVSGTCLECLAVANAGRSPLRVAPPSAGRPNDRASAAIAAYAGERVPIRIGIFNEINGPFREFLRMLCAARWPDVPINLFEPGPPKMQDGPPVYTFQLHPDDHKTALDEMHRMERAAHASQPIPSQAEIARRANALFADDDESSWPKGDPR